MFKILPIVVSILFLDSGFAQMMGVNIVGNQGEPGDRKTEGSISTQERVLSDSHIVEPPTVQSIGEAALRSGLEISLDTSFIGYEEDEFMNEEGAMLSLYGKYTLRPKSLMLRFDGRLGFGGMAYSSPISGTVNGIRDYILETRLLFGRTFAASNSWSMTPYSGFGYRYLFDGLGEKTTGTGHVGYDRKSNYLYSPIGLEISNSLSPQWSLITVMEYDLFWHGWQHSELGVVFGSNVHSVNDQDNGWGLRGSGKFTRKMGTFDIVAGPHFTYWNIEDSNRVNISVDGKNYSILEPGNTSKEIGGMFGVVF